MRKYVWVLLMAGFTLSCTANNSGTGTSSNFPWNGQPLVIANYNAATSIVSAEIANSNGPVTNAAVTTSGAAITMALNYLYNTTAAVTYGSAVTNIAVAYYNVNGISISGNVPATMAVSINGNNYSGNTTTMGNITYRVAGSNLIWTWIGGGNNNTIFAQETVNPWSTETFGPNLTSPTTIAASSLPGSMGQNNMAITIQNVNSAAFSGAVTGSYLLTSSQATTTY